MEHFKPSSRRKATVNLLLGKNVTAASASMRPKQPLKTETLKAIWGLMCAACDRQETADSHERPGRCGERRKLPDASAELLLSRFQETLQVLISNSCVEPRFYLWAESEVVGGQAD